MKVDVNDIKKIVLLWKSTSEKNLPISDEMQKEIDMYRNKKYHIIIMHSGSEDLFEPTLALLLKNKLISEFKFLSKLCEFIKRRNPEVISNFRAFSE